MYSNNFKKLMLIQNRISKINGSLQVITYYNDNKEISKKVTEIRRNCKEICEHLKNLEVK